MHDSNTTVSRVEQELLTVPKPLSSPSIFSGVRVAQSSVFCVVVLNNHKSETLQTTSWLTVFNYVECLSTERIKNDDLLEFI
jgi:hypothetical protein